MKLNEDLIDKICNQTLSDNEIQEIIEMNNNNLTMFIVKRQILNHNHCRYILNHYQKEEILQNNQLAKFMNFVHIKNEDDFLNHTKNHIKQVSLIAKEILDIILKNKDFKEYYKIPLDQNKEEILDVLLSVMVLHDQAKVNEDDDFLIKYGLEQPIYKKLYKFYGLGMSPELKSLVKQLNDIDQSIIEESLENQPNWMKHLISDIEKIADYIERGKNPITVEEMNSLHHISASEYHKDKMEGIPYQILSLTEKAGIL